MCKCNLSHYSGPYVEGPEALEALVCNVGGLCWLSFHGSLQRLLGSGFHTGAVIVRRK